MKKLAIAGILAALCSGGAQAQSYNLGTTILTLPTLTIDGSQYKYCNVQIYLRSNGTWDIRPLTLSLCSSANFPMTGYITNYVGIFSGTVFTLDNGTVWQGGSDCSIPQISGFYSIQERPQVTIYSISTTSGTGTGTTVSYTYSLKLADYPTNCTVTQIIK